MHRYLTSIRSMSILEAKEKELPSRWQLPTRMFVICIVSLSEIAGVSVMTAQLSTLTGCWSMFPKVCHAPDFGIWKCRSIIWEGNQEK